MPKTFYIIKWIGNAKNCKQQRKEEKLYNGTQKAKKKSYKRKYKRKITRKNTRNASKIKLPVTQKVNGLVKPVRIFHPINLDWDSSFRKRQFQSKLNVNEK